MSDPVKVRELYGGKIVLEFYEKPYHSYRFAGKKDKILSVTSATGMLNKPGLMYWSVNLMRDYLLEVLANGEEIGEAHILAGHKKHTEKKTEEATSGTMVHQWAESYIQAQMEGKPDPEMPDDERVINGATAFLKWVNEHKVKFIASELLVYSKKHKYAGMMDCKFTMGDEDHKIIHCGDFKTSSAIYPEMRYQVAGYQGADAEESDIIFGDAYIIRFDKDTADFEAVRLPEMEHCKDFDVFLGLLKAKKREQELN